VGAVSVGVSGMLGRKDAAVVVWRLRKRERGKDAFHVLSTVYSLTNRRSAMASLERPSAINASTSRSRSVRRSSGSRAWRGRPTS
jgi:hypothetical protein